MRKMISYCTAALLIAGSLAASPLKVYPTKNNGGLFGYKYVEETKMNNGDIFLKCDDPGYTRCKSQLSTARISYNGKDVDITAEQMDVIDATVMRLVRNDNTEGNSSGKFVYNENLFITYKYNIHSDKLEYVIYLIEEARDSGLL